MIFRNSAHLQNAKSVREREKKYAQTKNHHVVVGGGYVEYDLLI